MKIKYNLPNPFVLDHDYFEFTTNYLSKTNCILLTYYLGHHNFISYSTIRSLDCSCFRKNSYSIMDHHLAVVNMNDLVSHFVVLNSPFIYFLLNYFNLYY